MHKIKKILTKNLNFLKLIRYFICTFKKKIIILSLTKSLQKILYIHSEKISNSSQIKPYFSFDSNDNQLLFLTNILCSV